MARTSTVAASAAWANLLIVFAIFIANVICFRYDMWSIFGKDLGVGWSILGALVSAGIAIPVAVIFAILHAVGVAFPLVH